MVCVEQAIAIACGCAAEEQETITDAPKCVSPAVRRFAIVLNDAPWSSPQKRAAGLKAFALAQPGTQLLDEQEFSRRIALRAVTRLLPLTLRVVAAVVPQAAAEALEQAAQVCEAATDLSAARSAAESAAECAAESAAYSAASAAESAARDEMLYFTAQLATEVLDEMREGL